MGRQFKDVQVEKLSAQLLANDWLAGQSNAGGVGSYFKTKLSALAAYVGIAIRTDQLLFAIEDEGADPTYTNDSTAAINSAFTKAETYHGIVTARNGYFKVTGQITYKAPFRGLMACGQLPSPARNTHFLTTVNDGSAVIVIPPGFSYWSIENLIVSNVDGVQKNYTGIRAGTWGGDSANLGAGTACPGGTMRNVKAAYAAIGFDVQGWLMTFDNVIAASCVTGLRGEYLNASLIDYQATDCGQAAIVEESDCHFTRFFDEANGSSRTAASLFDGCDNLLISHYYSESDGGSAAIPWIKVGSKANTNAGGGTSSGQCNNFRISSGVVGAVASGYKIVIDRCEVFDLGVQKYNLWETDLYSTTANSSGDGTSVHRLTSYTPAFTSSGGGAALGSSTLSGSYTKSGRQIDVAMSLVITTGGAWNGGSGIWQFALPKKADSSGNLAVGSARIFKNGSASYAGIVSIDTSGGGNGVALVYFDGGGNACGNAFYPGASPWATGDAIHMSLSYRGI